MDRTFALPRIAACRIRARGGSRHRLVALAPACVLALLAACGTTPRIPPNVSRLPPGNSERDGPEAHPPADLWAVPDAVPQIEPVRVGGPNKPYDVDGHTYVPITDDRAVVERGLASWYGKKFHGHRTSSGEAYNMYAMTAAHKTLPIPSYARVRNPANDREVIVRVNDRGPFVSGRIIDLSYTAALKLGVLGGVQNVEVEHITDEDIRTGAAFQHGGTRLASTVPAAARNPPAPVATTTTTTVTTTVAMLPSEASGLAPRPASSPPSPQAIAASSMGTPVGLTPLPAPAGASGFASPPAASAAAIAPAIASASAPGWQPAFVASTGSAPVPLAGDPSARAAAPASVDSATSRRVDPATSTLPPVAEFTAPPSVTPVADAAAAPPAALPSAAPAAPTPAQTVDALPPLHEESGHALTPGGAGFWVQIGAYRQRNGALDFQHRLVDEQPWLAPLLAVFSENGLNRLQAGPYGTREDARSAAERIRLALQLVPTIVEKR